MNRHFAPALLTLALLAGCASKPKEPDYKKECPPKVTQAVLGNQRALGLVEVGKTHIGDLKGLSAPTRTIMLSHFGEADVKVALYPTAVTGCPIMLPGATYTPVVIGDDGTVIGMGMDDMDKLHAKGWTVLGATWPWQNYDYAYIPFK